MSGLLAGCHAIVFDGSRVMSLDGFAAVPSAEGEIEELPIPFGDELVVYAIGAGVVRRAWAPGGARRALGAARTASVEDGSASPRWRSPEQACRFPRCTRARSGCSASSSRSGRGGEIFTREGGCSPRATSSTSPASSRRSRRSPRRERRASIEARLPRRFCSVDGIVLTADDLADYRPLWRDPVLVEYAGRRDRDARRPLGCPGSAPASSPPRRAQATDRVLALVETFEPCRRAASTPPTWSRSTRTGARACSRIPSASAPESGFPASTCS